MKRVKKSLFIAIALTITSLVAFMGCSKKSEKASADGEKKTLTYSRSQGPYTVLFESGVKPILEAKGYTLKGFDYSELALADDAVNGGDVDFNVEQHTAYANNYNEGNNGKLVPITPIPTVPASLFSSHYKSADDIKNLSKPKVAVPNDPANTARAYVLLQKIGWITLKDGVNLSTVTSEDINSNPYNIQFTEMKSLNIPQVVVREDNKDSQWAKDIVAAYHSKEFKDYLEKTNYENGLFWIPDDYEFN